MLHKFEQNEIDLHTTLNNTKFLQSHLEYKKTQVVPNGLIDIYNCPEEMDNFSEEENLDLDAYTTSLTCASTSLKKEKCRSWNGNLYHQLLSAENPWSVNNTEYSPTQEPIEVSQEHSFMSLVLAGKNPSGPRENAVIEQIPAYTDSDRATEAVQFLNTSLNDCKNNEQKNALKTITNVLEAYYFGNYKHGAKITKESLKSTPAMTMIGVPGAGKSRIIGKIRTSIDVSFKTNDVRYTSPEFEAINQTECSDPVSENIRESIAHLSEGRYGKSVAFAFSGSAAGIIKGFTVHHGFSFPLKLNKQVITGELPLPEIRDSIRTKLLECWCSVKPVTIDEVYMLKVEWLSLIDKRLKQIFNSNTPFAGIPILISGDPRQIVPVQGRALFIIQKYFDLKSTNPKLTKRGIIFLSEREERGFLLYVSSRFTVPLLESVRICDKKFAGLNMKIAQYELTPQDVENINTFYQSKHILEQPPWIDCPWLFPTWEEVNIHLQVVTERAKTQKGIFRAWYPVTVENSRTSKSYKKALQTFYQSSTFVSAKFTCPFPYIDYFIGQIVCLNKNWNPTWKLFNNAKAFIIGIKCNSPERQRNPLMAMDEAISLCLKSPDLLRYNLLVKPLTPFTGPSTIPNVPGIIEVPWTEVVRRISGCKLEIEGPVHGPFHFCLLRMAFPSPKSSFRHHKPGYIENASTVS